jgi:hypothetical protein
MLVLVFVLVCLRGERVDGESGSVRVCVSPGPPFRKTITQWCILSCPHPPRRAMSLLVDDGRERERVVRITRTR